ncbi:hypothetical protein VTJ83DRAFT_7027 [Remersonia thermophila]|uniref:MARVEL domain-containing protein n=1 Tax=Remersonia thermophila TaxID=72144 RepID=A0ABR4D2C3_9PEZI
MGLGDFFTGRIPRWLVTLSNFVIFASSAILVGTISYFVRWGYRGTWWIYPLVIAVVTLFIYLITMFLPILKRYRGYMLPVNFILSYLWVTALIFAAQRFAGGRCVFYPVPRRGCSVAHAILTFWIIGFVFLIFNIIMEALMWAHHWRESRHTVHDAEKSQPLTSGAAPATAPVGAPPTAAA